MEPVAEKNVIASRKAAWQSASPAMHRIARPLKGPEGERIATGLRPRNDMGFIRGPIQLSNPVDGGKPPSYGCFIKF